MRSWILGATMALLGALAVPAQAVVVATTLSTPLTTPDNPAGGDFDGTGIWFNPLTGQAEVRGYFFPDPLFADGLFFLLRNTSFTPAGAQVYTQGFFSRGNGVIYESAANLNPAQFGAGTVIGPGTGHQSPGAGFTDLGPTFGNWGGTDHGFLGLTIRDASGASPSDVFYGFAEITVTDDFGITLHAFAYESERGAPITTFFAPVPEPASAALLTLGLAGLAAAGAVRRRRDRRDTA